MPKRPPTAGTRHGNGAGWGGAAKGAGSGAPQQLTGPGTNAQGHSKRTPVAAGNRRALRVEQGEALKDVLYELAMAPEQPGTVRVQAANAFIDRVEGKPVARQEVKLNVDPNELSDAELAALIRAEDDDTAVH